MASPSAMGSAIGIMMAKHVHDDPRVKDMMQATRKMMDGSDETGASEPMSETRYGPISSAREIWPRAKAKTMSTVTPTSPAEPLSTRSVDSWRSEEHTSELQSR